MTIYIDAKLAEKNIDNADTSWCTDVDNIIEACIEALQSTPQADVAPVIHAHWTIIYEPTAGVTDAKCSNCGYESLAYENDVHIDNDCHYCPCCGAKMDEEVNDG